MITSYKHSSLKCGSNRATMSVIATIDWKFQLLKRFQAV